jgi:hypothetical protein
VHGVVDSGMARSQAHWGLRSIALPAFLMALATTAWSFDSSIPSSALAQQAGSQNPLSQLEVSTSSIPRMDVEGGTRESRIDMTWMAPRQSALGLMLGMSSQNASGLAPYRPFSTGPALDLGLQWRYTLDNNYRVDVTAWHRIMPPDALSLIQTRQQSYGARVEMRIPSAPYNGLVADLNFIGLQLEGGARVTVKRANGGPMFYYRSNF